MIPNEEKKGWRYLVVKNYLHYYIKNPSNHEYDLALSGLNCLNSFRTENKLKIHKKKNLRIKISVGFKFHQEKIKY